MSIDELYAEMTSTDTDVNMNRPICINYGCNKSVKATGKRSDGQLRWKVHCQDCYTANYGAKPLAEGVTAWKTGRCSNVNSRLGFPCITNFDLIQPWMKGLTEVDHIDGNPANNDYSNLQELCPMCHKFKGQLAGDFKRQGKRIG